MKYARSNNYGLIWWIGLAFCLPFLAWAQPQGKVYDVVEGVDRSQLKPHDIQLLDSMLRLYHQTQDDTQQIKYLSVLAEQLYSEKEWPKYNDYILQLAQSALEQSNSSPAYHRFYRKQYGFALNNKGYLAQRKGDLKEAIYFYEQSLEISNQLHDTAALASLYNNLGLIHKIQGEIDEAMESYELSSLFYEVVKDEKGKALSLNNLGMIYERRDFDKAIEYMERSLEIYRKINNKPGIAMTTNNLALIFNRQGDVQRSLAYHEEAIRLYEETDDLRGVANSYNNLASIYSMQGEDSLSLLYFQKSLDISIKAKSKHGIALSKNNIGRWYMRAGRTAEAMANFKQTLDIYKQIGDQEGMAYSLTNIGGVFHGLGEIDSAISYFNQSLLIREGLDTKEGISHSNSDLSQMYFIKGDWSKAEKLARKAYNTSTDLGDIQLIQLSSQSLYEALRAQQKWEEALQYYQTYIQMRDSLSNEENAKAAIKQQMAYVFENREAILQADKEKEELAHEAKIKRQQLTLWAVGIGLLLVFLFSVFLFNRYKVTQQQKEIIEEQKHLVDLKNKHITDSIAYAQKIQEAILPSEEQFAVAFGEGNAMVFFQPKDVVSGDFYWLHEPDPNKVIWAVADCTGHGVPGAFMSMIGNSLLNEVVVEKGIHAPKDILNELREGIKKAMGQSSASRKDGMDIALCCWDKGSRTVTYAGAYNPLYLFRKGTLQEYKADRQPVGAYIKEAPFQQETIPLMPGDILYTFSDGFQDQFGGPKQKKYTSKRFKTLLQQLHKAPPNTQSTHLSQAFTQWRSTQEQMDDICIMGVQIT